ncbi:helix-turn-helix transcriptional regulator [Chroococcidiopsis sp. CCMEE 29]|uniref:helix-turn-helix domain-containing protein n=1 Tax=Chroococcidiopsis sp. CCMEE 29 TaxID=155894 RepID=UPI00201FD9F1|nr:helix-turn-helix transcriptional regulator [Chroococcidiopsis sp. CCMEE 29]
MIKNERQYRVTKTQAQKFEQALAQLAKYSEEMKKENPLLWQAQKSALESQLNDLREEIEEYNALTPNSVNRTVVFTVDSLEALPRALIKARIAAKLSQKDLAERLGLKEQQIQRYEATEYASANFARVIEVSQALGMRLQPKAEIQVEVGRSHPR